MNPPNFPTQKCTLTDGEITVENKETGVVICENLQKDYFNCLRTMLGLNSSENTETEPQPKPATRPKTKPNRRNELPPEECWGDNCPRSDEPIPF